MRLPPDADTWWVVDPAMDRERYVRRLLDLYRETPTTCGTVHPRDRQLLEHLFRRGVPFTAVEAAFLLAAARRVYRDPRLDPLPPIRSLKYFLPIIREILDTPVDPGEIGFLEWKLRNVEPPKLECAEAIAW
ncbi:MAG: hypothetical protein GY835_08960 [bacterium]|nr:hypothetical protein [bacterium]